MSVYTRQPRTTHGAHLLCKTGFCILLMSDTVRTEVMSFRLNTLALTKLTKCYEGKVCMSCTALPPRTTCLRRTQYDRDQCSHHPLRNINQESSDTCICKGTVMHADCEVYWVQTMTGPGGMAGPLRVDLEGKWSRSPNAVLQEYSPHEAQAAFDRTASNHRRTGWGIPGR